ncbi:beta strand repeat-containing protein, partial [Flavobacterium sp. LB3P122]|uniref:beta strand repeat-containing protein n=1 Tax=Flavobacterium algoriphilum TaxID=3398738 RepID=UPI003A87C9F3
ATADGKAVAAQSDATTALANAATADTKAVAAQGTATTALSNAATADTKAVAAQGTATTALANAATADGKAVAAQGTADTALGDAATALTNAATAQTAAEAADTNAATAQTTAEAADGKAVAAQGTADTALTNAATAQTAAEVADKNAATAQTAAEAADTKAVAAQGAAEAADTNVGIAQTAAEAADGKAVAAQGTADNALANAAIADAKAVAASSALVTENERATTAENTIANNLTTETGARISADTTLAADLATEVTNRAAADLLKEDVVNKSTNVTTDAASDTKYPSVKSVKSYVDASATTALSALATETANRISADNLKANLASPTFTGTVSGIDKTMVGLGNVDNTSDASKPVSALQQTALNLKEDVVNKSTNVTTDAASDTKYPSVKSVKSYVDASAITASSALATETANRISADNLKANLASPTFTGTVSGIDKTMVGLGNVDNTSDASKPVSALQQTALNLKEDVVNKSTNVTTDAASDTKYPSVKSVKSYVDASATTASSALATETANRISADNLKANLASPTFTGTVSGIDKTMVGLGNVDNTSDASKPVSALQQTALNLKEDVVNKSTNVTTDAASDTKYPSVKSVKTYVDTSATTASSALATETANRISADNLKANLASPTFTGTVSGIDKTMVGLGNVDNTSDTSKPVSALQQTALNLKANLASPTFTGTVSGIDKTMVGLGNVDNTSDTSKPVSTTQQTALNLKANLASPSFTGTVSGIDKTMVGLGNVNNTSDASKPVSTATQIALDLKEDLSNKSNTITLGASITLYPTQNAVKTYVDNQVAATTTPDATSSVKGKIQLAGDLSGTAAVPTIASVGGVTAANVASGANLANAATNINTSSTIVKRDASGNFSAGTITAALNGNATTATTAGTVTTNANLTGDVSSVGNTTTLSITGVTAGTYPKVTVDAKGRVTAGAALLVSDIPTLNQNTTGTATNVTGTVAVANGGTGSTTQNFVDLTTTQSSIAGAKTFTSTLTASAGATISGATTSINNNSNFNTDINTGSSTGTVTIGSATGNGIRIGNGRMAINKPTAPVTSNGNPILTPAQVVDAGIVVMTGTSKNVTLPDATSLAGVMPGGVAVTGDVITFVIVPGTGSSGITVVAGLGGTLVGPAAITTSRVVTIRFTSSTAYSVY